MHHYQYQYGDQPLAGYTIQRAAGCGGFGEVYYAISDSGRQVALKTVQNYEHIELRGIKQCMNLKSPHLVSVFDVKYNDKGRPFVIMEFVSGMSLRDILDESPQGIGTQKAAFFLREIAKGLSHLHECGIVHRDLKPSNIFYENGYVKIGDYGLTKAITQSTHSAQTVTVGTVHYMAPEIGEGKYDFSIDIYALGILFYEMLTGQVPFFGASPGEVLMKHMSSTPDLTGVDETFARVIRKALAKDPGERYQTIQEMVEDVFGAEHIRQSVSQFSPESLSMIAEKVANKAKASTPSPSPHPAIDEGGMGENIGRKLGAAGDKIARQMADVASKFRKGSKDFTSPEPDTLDRKQRRILTLITMGMIGLAVGILISDGRPDNIVGLGLTSFFMVGAGSLGLHFGRNRLLKGMEPGLLRQWAPVAIAILLAAICALPASNAIHYFGRGLKGMLLSMAALGFVNWWDLMNPQRKQRIVWGPVVGAGALALLIGAIAGGQVMGAGLVAGILIVIQVATPFLKPGVMKPIKKAAPKPEKIDTSIPTAPPVPNQENPAAPVSPKKERPSTILKNQRKVPSWIRALMLAGCIIGFGVGLFALLASGFADLHREEFAAAISVGVGCILTSLWCLLRACRWSMTSWYRYIIKPALLHICLLATITASICLGNLDFRGEEQALMIFLIIFPVILFLVILFFPSRSVEELFQMQRPQPSPSTIRRASPRKRTWALLLALPFFPSGLHRFYVGKIVSGIVWFFTGGLFGIGQLIDIIMILTGSFQDAEGRPLLLWWEPENQGFDANYSAPIPAQNPPQVPAAGVTESPTPAPADSESQTPEPPSEVRSTVVHRAPFHPIGALIATFGYILVLLAAIVACMGALHLPHLLALGGPSDVTQELSNIFGYQDWPRLVERLAFVIALATMVLAGILVAAGRRHAGSWHVLRAVLGMGILVISLYPFCGMVPGHYFSDSGVQALWHNGQIGQALEHMLNHIDDEAVTWAGALFVTALVCLLWPPRTTASLEPIDMTQGVQ